MTFKRERKILIVLFLVMLITGLLGYTVWTSFPQPETPALSRLNISGPCIAEVGDEVVFTVTSENKTIEGVTVTLLEGTECITNSSGSASLRFEKVGAYKVIVSKDGYESSYMLVQVYPKGNNEIPVRGLRWRTRPFFQTPHTIRTMGANYVQFKADYYIDDDFNLIPLVFNCNPPIDTPAFIPASKEEMRAKTKKEIREVRAVGLKIHFFTYIRYADAGLLEHRAIPSSENTTKLLSQLKEEMIEWAKFLEAENVEMFTPTQFLEKYVGPELRTSWYKDILPELRKYYSGKLIIPQMRTQFEDYDYSGYDYLGLIFLPVNVHSWTELNQSIVERFDKAASIKMRDNIDIIVTLIGGPVENTEELWMPLQDDPGEIKSRVYKMVMGEAMRRIKSGEVEGVFFYEWDYGVATHAWSQRKGDQWEMVDKYQGKKPAQVIEDYFLETPYTVTAYRLNDLERIEVDGKSSDWNKINPIVIDPQGDSYDWKGGKPTDNKNDDIKAAYVARDNEQLYIMVEYYGKTSKETIFEIDLDLDGNRDIYKSDASHDEVAEVVIPLNSLGDVKNIYIEIYSNFDSDKVEQDVVIE